MSKLNGPIRNIKTHETEDDSLPAVENSFSIIPFQCEVSIMLNSKFFEPTPLHVGKLKSDLSEIIHTFNVIKNRFLVNASFIEHGIGMSNRTEHQFF